MIISLFSCADSPAETKEIAPEPEYSLKIVINAPTEYTFDISAGAKLQLDGTGTGMHEFEANIAIDDNVSVSINNSNIEEKSIFIYYNGVLAESSTETIDNLRLIAIFD